MNVPAYEESKERDTQRPRERPSFGDTDNSRPSSAGRVEIYTRTDL
jgi:hypothetical protein